MIRSRIRSDMERVKDIPFFPLIPIVPIALAATGLALTGLILFETRKILHLLEARENG